MGLCLYMSRDSHMKHKILIDFIFVWSVGTNSFPTKFCSSIYNALLCKSFYTKYRYNLWPVYFHVFQQNVTVNFFGAQFFNFIQWMLIPWNSQKTKVWNKINKTGLQPISRPVEWMNEWMKMFILLSYMCYF